MSVAAGVFRGVICTSQTNLEGYFRQAWPQLYFVATYDGGWKAFFMELINYYCNFLWSFMDIFIIAISICLSTRFRQLNDHLEKFKGMVNGWDFCLWPANETPLYLFVYIENYGNVTDDGQ